MKNTKKKTKKTNLNEMEKATGGVGIPFSLNSTQLESTRSISENELAGLSRLQKLGEILERRHISLPEFDHKSKILELMRPSYDRLDNGYQPLG